MIRSDGHLKEEFGCSMIDDVREGHCEECATKHDEIQPHNQQSLHYQYKFYDKHGRWPTWSDAMAHCPSDVQSLWTQALKEQGIAVDGVKNG